VGPDFLNVVILICTTLTPEELKSKVINEIEITLGRERTKNKNAPRTIDIDILIVDEKLYDAEVWKQAHMAVPLAELIPDYAHPVTGETLEHVAQQLAKRTPISTQSNVTGIIAIRDD
jgi:7,8-dihydro-6-hydroxymethylpterin-pyrophosphokinase